MKRDTEMVWRECRNDAEMIQTKSMVVQIWSSLPDMEWKWCSSAFSCTRNGAFLGNVGKLDYILST